MERKRVDIEKLLQWAYRDELPKKGAGVASQWDAIAGYAESGGQRIDDGGLPSYPAAMGEPHRDAVSIGQRVAELGDLTLDWSESRAVLLGDLVALAPRAAPSLMLAPLRTAALVMMHARMGTRPPWDGPRPRCGRLIGGNGKPAVEGRKPNGLYAEGAYCPLVWSPPVEELALARAEYAAWHRALIELAESLILINHVPLLPAAPAEPWRTGAEIAPRIVRDLIAAKRFSPRPRMKRRGAVHRARQGA